MSCSARPCQFPVQARGWLMALLFCLGKRCQGSCSRPQGTSGSPQGWGGPRWVINQALPSVSPRMLGTPKLSIYTLEESPNHPIPLPHLRRGKQVMCVQGQQLESNYQQATAGTRVSWPYSVNGLSRCCAPASGRAWLPEISSMQNPTKRPPLIPTALLPTPDLRSEHSLLHHPFQDLRAPLQCWAFLSLLGSLPFSLPPPCTLPP